ncbi:MAG: HAD family hydrolase, partial [Microcystaceae cyanobacterium]
MKRVTPLILALDFDGVVCDGLAEYFQSTKRAYCRIWPSYSSEELDSFTEQFYSLRPVIETGWEMIVLLRALVLATPEIEIIEHWPNVVKVRLMEDRLEKNFLMETLDQVRDEWIQSDLEKWLSLHRFYPGVIERLNGILRSPTLLYIITTKEGKFVQKLLTEQGLKLEPNQIFGKEIKQPKAQTLQQILTQHQIKPEELWFIEDLLKTLQKIQEQPDLSGIGLFLADWGYNTPAMRDSLGHQSAIQLLSL